MRAAALILLAATCVPATPAAAQQTVSDVLSFLLTNRSIATGDFVRDSRAAAATRDTLSAFLLSEIATLPVVSSAAAFTYRLDRSLGSVVRSSDSFGPLFVERSLTSGRFRGSFAINYQAVSFDSIDGRGLKDGTLVSTAARLQGEAQPFDVETVFLDIRARTMTVLGHVGVTDRLDVGVALPFVALSLHGRRVDTYRGAELVQATGSASAWGPGDFLIRGKYNVVRRAGRGLAIAGEARLPTGNERNLLGTGKGSIKPRLIASLERDRVAVHGDVGYALGGVSDELVYGGAVTVAGTSRLTLVAELAGRRMSASGRLTDTTQPHPTLRAVDTIRLGSVEGTTDRMVAIAGVKWNVVNTLLLSGSVARPLTSAGLNAHWSPTVSLDYSFEP